MASAWVLTADLLGKRRVRCRPGLTAQGWPWVKTTASPRLRRSGDPSDGDMRRMDRNGPGSGAGGEVRTGVGYGAWGIVIVFTGVSG